MTERIKTAMRIYIKTGQILKYHSLVHKQKD